MTRKQLAFGVGLSKSALAGIENGHHAPGLKTAMKIAAALNADIAELFDFHPCECGCGELTAKQYVKGHNTGLPEHRAGCTRAHQERRQRLGIPEEKVCEHCGRTYSRSEVPRQSLAHWLERRYCSWDCFLPNKPQERFCHYWKCWKLFTPEDNDPTNLFCSPACGQKNRMAEKIRDGKPLVAKQFVLALPTTPSARYPKPGGARKHHAGELFGRQGGRRRREDRPDFEALIAQIRADRDELMRTTGKASERDLRLRATRAGFRNVSRQTVRIALGRPV